MKTAEKPQGNNLLTDVMEGIRNDITFAIETIKGINQRNVERQVGRGTQMVFDVCNTVAVTVALALSPVKNTIKELQKRA